MRPSLSFSMVSPFDSLPDSVACLVLSKLKSARHVARCAIVCARWKCLVKWVDTLEFLPSHHAMEERAQDLEAIVTRFLAGTLGVRHLSVCYHPVVWPWIADDHFKDEAVLTWIAHVSPSLEELTLVDPNRITPQGERLAALSTCARLQHLNLCYGLLPVLPPTCERFQSLHCLVLDLLVLSDASLERLVSLTPLLHHLRLNSCVGLHSPTLVSPSLRHLAVVHDMDGTRSRGALERLSLDTPCLEVLLLVEVGVLVGVQLSSLVSLQLRCHVTPLLHAPLPQLKQLSMWGEGWALESVNEWLRNAGRLEGLCIEGRMAEVRGIKLEGLMQNMGELRRIDIGADFFRCLQAGGGKVGRFGSIPKAMHLEDIRLVLSCASSKTLDVIVGLLKMSSRMRRLTIDTEKLASGEENLSFFTRVLALQRGNPQIEIILICPEILL